jgi:ApaG protein
METLITKGIRVSVENSYQPQYSNPLANKYIFAYRITIENLSPATVQLLRRHWEIIDSNGIHRQVDGEGVIGQQPILEPGETHQYVSWCHLTTAMGRMCGTYQMQDQFSKEIFSVKIPLFDLIAPFQLN